MNRQIVLFALLAFSSAQVVAAEYVCRIPGGKTIIQDRPCPADAKTTYQNTRPYETREETQARVREADMLINGPARRETAEREAERAAREEARLSALKKKQEEEEKRAKIAREQALIDEMRKTRQAAEAAAANSEAQPRGMNCFQFGAFMDCKPR